MRYLIVNADDFNLTEGVSRAILAAHDRGIVSSTSVFANLGLTSFQKKALFGTGKNLGVGLHLNVTFGKPLAKLESVTSILDSSGSFQKTRFYRDEKFSIRDLEVEFRAQLHWFYHVFRRPPDHLNTHHHIHAFPRVFEVISKLGAKYDIPIRRVGVLRDRFLKGPVPKARCQTTDYLFGNLSPKKYWSFESLATILRNLPEGASEIMCHPGFVDSELRGKSSFTIGREREFKLFSKSSLKSLLKAKSVQLIPRL